MKVTIKADVVPVPFKRVLGGNHRYNDKRYSEYKDVLGFFALQAMHGQEPFTGAIKLHVDIYKRTPKDITARNWGDLDNHVKAIMDALTGICYLDDRQVTELSARKLFGSPKVIIVLEEL